MRFINEIPFHVLADTNIGETGLFRGRRILRRFRSRDARALDGVNTIADLTQIFILSELRLYKRDESEISAPGIAGREDAGGAEVGIDGVQHCAGCGLQMIG